MNLTDLKPAPSSSKRRKIIGRGSGSGHGKTSGRGHKGDKARGSISLGFEGGQTPLHRRLPKQRGIGTGLSARGFNSGFFKTSFTTVNVGALNKCFESNAIVTYEALVERRLIQNRPSPIKILGDGKLNKSLTVYADRVSLGAQAAILAAGGTIFEPDGKESIQYDCITLHEIDAAFTVDEEVNPRTLFNKGLLHSRSALVEVHGKGKLSKPLLVKAHKFSSGAIDDIADSGGEAVTASSLYPTIFTSILARKPWATDVLRSITLSGGKAMYSVYGEVVGVDEDQHLANLQLFGEHGTYLYQHPIDPISLNVGQIVFCRFYEADRRTTAMVDVTVISGGERTESQEQELQDLYDEELKASLDFEKAFFPPRNGS